jgi:large subunit ribosomal protein L13|tara:strand:+ start:976 stop:1446 length:471 start_codon:yes stop_codon:yes gene_type:complete
MRAPAHYFNNKFILMRTQSYKRTDIEESWLLIDAKGKTLGRLASEVASILSGKNKPEYTPNADLGDFVVVVNANEIHVTGKKLDQKIYYRHSGYPGGIKSKPLRDIMENSASDAIKSAVKGMLPKSKLGRQMFTKLKVYNDDNHPHAAQKPVTLDI